MELSAEEVREFWRDFCERHKVGADFIAKGNAKIDADPDYWADHTMWQLLEAVGGQAARKNQG